MARTAVIEFWRNISGSSPNIIMDRWIYTAATDTVSFESINIGTGGLGPFHPPAGTFLTGECDGDHLVQYYSLGNNSGVNDVQTNNSIFCCTLVAGDFQVNKTNNTSLITPNGTIVITSSTEDIAEYEASINGGAYVTQVAGAITFADLPAGSYSINIKSIGGTCNVTVAVDIIDNISYPPPIIEETTSPAEYAPVFHPIIMGFSLQNNNATVKQDINGTYLEVDTEDEKDYLETLPIIKIYGNEDYEGSYKIQSVDDVDDPTKFYINAIFTTEQVVNFVPFDRQIFSLYAEITANNFRKIASISTYPDPDTGEYRLRLEGFLQSVFSIAPPLNNGEEITLLRKYYVIPEGFDLAEPYTVYNAVYSAVESLTDFIGDLIPLGPAPINFINEQTQKGYPVLFSYIDTAVGRVRNVTSSNQTDVVSAGSLVYIPALPFNTYDLTWVNPLGAIADLNISPALPSWITLESSPTDTVKLTIDTNLGTGDGDYDGNDYSGDDYLTGGPNSIVGCYEFEFFDGVTLLFTLEICVFPIQKSNAACFKNPMNIAWVNREGGWSSYLFDGRKVHGGEIGQVRTYKAGLELKRSSVEDVYDYVEILIDQKNKKDLDFIASLRRSIQAFLWDEGTLQWSIPIILDPGNFKKYDIPFEQAVQSDKFRFRYAKEVVIQTQ